MEIIHLPRGEGKTEELLRHLRYDPGAIMIVANEQRRVHTVARLVANGMPTHAADSRVVRVDSWLKTGKTWKINERLVIDDLEDVLYQLLGQTVKVVTATKEEGNGSTANNRNRVS